MNILQIHDYPPLEGGGIEVNVSRVSDLLIKQGNTVTIATGRFKSETYSEKSTDEIVTDTGLRVVLLDSFSKLKALIEQADIVNIHFTFSCRIATMQALDYCVSSGKKCIVSIETELDHVPFSRLSEISPFERDTVLESVKRYFNAPNVILSSPAFSVQKTLDRLGIKKKLNVVRNGITLGIYEQFKDESITPVDITYVGEISLLKGIKYLLEAVNMLKQEGLSLKLRLIGNGSHMQEIKQLVEYFGLMDQVEFTGYIKNYQISAYLAKTKFYIQPSLTEVWPGSVTEALASGVPVIASSVGGLPEMVTQNNDTFATLVPAANATFLAQQIRRSLEPENYSKLVVRAQRAKEYFSKTFTFENQAKSLNNLYKTIYV